MSVITAKDLIKYSDRMYLILVLLLFASFLGRKVMTNLDSIFKSRDITLPTKVHLVKAMVIPVVMYVCEIWTVKKAERRRIDTFELWCWRRLLRVPWTARRSNQSILKEIFGRNDAKAETPVLWPHHAKSWLTGKDSDAGRCQGPAPVDPGNSRVGTALASLEMTYLITDREGLED